MPLLGVHLSIAGGLYKAVEAAMSLGMDTVQIFTHSPSQWLVEPVKSTAGKRPAKSNAANSKGWKRKTLNEEDVTRFRNALRDSRLLYPTAHDSYLINLASPDQALRHQSIEAFITEMQRAEALGLAYLVMHPGAHMGDGEEKGLERVIASLDECHAQCPGFSVQVLLELTAGQGSSLGYRFEHIATILDGVATPDRYGVCLDTCHIYAAGYEFSTTEQYQQTFAEFDRLIGISNLKLFHLNDSKKPLGSRVDRHEHIGQGHLGREPFRHIVNDPRFAELPMVLETPKTGEDDEQMDPINLKVLRDLME